MVRSAERFLDSSFQNVTRSIQEGHVITIRKIGMEDLVPFTECMNDKDLVINAYDDDFQPPYTVADAQVYIKKCSKDHENPEYTILADNRFAGTVSLDIENKEKKEYSIGYFVSTDFRGKGIATNAVREAVRIAFKKHKAKAVVAEVFENNVGSARVLEKAGFRLIGIVVKNGIVNKSYRLDKEDYRQAD